MTDDEKARAHLISVTSEARMAEHLRFLDKLGESTHIAERVAQHPALAEALRVYRDGVWVCERSPSEDLNANLHWAEAARISFSLTLSQIEATLDPDRLRGAKVKRAARDGGDIRRGQTAPETARKLAEMARLIKGGHSVASAAAALARKGGYGGKGALVKLWGRHRK